ncbi:substrate-binding periplasmic protein [Desulfocurvus vexinensis]|uniref:substrate-binding periplasmic protein n=1 Tax=Desulfocurvus vexinensis TaxID=399548 RepID=UPI0004B12E1C|nr:transporter substrate-binding domain-containing protein [Desulfocurvus vexinensis]
MSAPRTPARFPALAAALLCALLLCLPPGPAPAREPAPQLVVVGNNAPPFRIIDGGAFYGIYYDAMLEIARRAGLRVRFVEAPFQRSLAMMELGEADIMLGPNRTPEREAFMVYTRVRFPPADKAFYVYPGTPRVTAHADLAAMTVAVQRGARYYPEFDDDPTLRKVECFDQIQALEKVLTGECDAMLMPEQEADYLLMHLGVGLKKSPYVVPGKPPYLTIARRSEAALAEREAMEEAMRTMIEDGTMQAILERYR